MIDVDRCYCCQSSAFEFLFEQTADDPYLHLIGKAEGPSASKWMVCRGCGFVSQTPQLGPGDMDGLYRDYRLNEFRGETPDAYFDRISSYPPEESENFKKVEWLNKAGAVGAADGGKILDIGCGGGLLLHSFLRRHPDWIAHGVEPTPNFAELAGRRLKSDVRSCSYEAGLFGHQFDLISMVQVLEHVADPVEFLRQAKSDLSADGYLYVEVPDVHDFCDLAPTHDRFMAPHLWYFSEQSLGHLCRRAGLAPVRFDREFTVRNRNNLQALCRHADTKVEPAWDTNHWQDVKSLFELNEHAGAS
ncbi:MAG: class I SAM-dependent methyltransferase [Rhodospirillaceae bacterium]|nr:class I SAM-dependent methyltransferase [Rhodospirillaceae bacterium]MBT7510965.1 class I SAM-dependent methyltransferase [Rhodospirillaceae bacterium]